MSKKSKVSKSTARSAETSSVRRRTRMIALEPRMLFDGALGVDLGVKATAVVLGDSSAPSADGTITPAATEAPKDTTKAAPAAAQAASATPAEKDAVQKPGAEALDAASKP